MFNKGYRIRNYDFKLILMILALSSIGVFAVGSAQQSVQQKQLIGVIADVTVDAATELALIFGMSDRLIGLTIVAFGTSLPELVTSVTAAVKGKADIAVGNIVGSNIFNILFVVGTTALITSVVYSANFLVDSIVAVATMVLLLICVLPKKKLGRLGGVVMLAGYAAYFIYLIR